MFALVNRSNGEIVYRSMYLEKVKDVLRQINGDDLVFKIEMLPRNVARRQEKANV